MGPAGRRVPPSPSLAPHPARPCPGPGRADGGKPAPQPQLTPDSCSPPAAPLFRGEGGTRGPAPGWRQHHRPAPASSSLSARAGATPALLLDSNSHVSEPGISRARALRLPRTVLALPGSRQDTCCPLSQLTPQHPGSCTSAPPRDIPSQGKQLVLNRTYPGTKG